MVCWFEFNPDQNVTISGFFFLFRFSLQTRRYYLHFLLSSFSFFFIFWTTCWDGRKRDICKHIQFYFWYSLIPNWLDGMLFSSKVFHSTNPLIWWICYKKDWIKFMNERGFELFMVFEFLSVYHLVNRLVYLKFRNLETISYPLRSHTCEQNALVAWK